MDINKKSKFGFLQSVRFWKVVIAVVLESLVAYSVIDFTAGVAIAHIISLVLGISVTIRTVDKVSETLSK